VEFPDEPRTTFVGAREQERLALDEELLKLTVPVNPLRDFTVIVEFAREPAFTATVEGVATSWKGKITTETPTITK